MSKLTVKSRDFMCDCTPKEKKRAEAIYHEVRKRLAHEGEELAPEGHFLSRVVYSLQWDYDAEILSIRCDQWCSVTAAQQTLVKDEDEPSGFRLEDKTRVYMQCDVVEHGVAAVWKWFADNTEKVEK